MSLSPHLNAVLRRSEDAGLPPMCPAEAQELVTRAMSDAMDPEADPAKGWALVAAVALAAAVFARRNKATMKTTAGAAAATTADVQWYLSRMGR